MLEKGEVSRVDVIQNEEVPTGTLQVTTTEDEVLTVNVSDVNAAQEMLSAYDVTVDVENVSRSGILFTSILPVILMSVMFLFLIMFLNRQQGGGSGSGEDADQQEKGAVRGDSVLARQAVVFQKLRRLVVAQLPACQLVEYVQFTASSVIVYAIVCPRVRVIAPIQPVPHPVEVCQLFIRDFPDLKVLKHLAACPGRNPEVFVLVGAFICLPKFLRVIEKLLSEPFLRNIQIA